MSKWLNEEKGILSSVEQLEPVLDDKGNLIYGHQLPNGEFKQDPAGPDILHRPVPGQIQVAEDDSRVIAFHNRRVKTIDQQVEDHMNSPAVMAVRTILNADAAADARIRQSLKAKLQTDLQQASASKNPSNLK
jgi:hypothetical protein